MKEIIFRSLCNLGVPRLLRISKKNTVTVLNLHRISEDRSFFYDPIKPSTFYKLIDYCCKHYDIISFKDITRPTPKPKLILSFDDGYYDFIECALPYLIRKGLPSNHNVVNESVNNNTPIWTQKLNDLFDVLKEQSVTNDPTISSYSEYASSWNAYYIKFFHYLLTIERNLRDEILNSLLIKYNVKCSCKMMNWDDLRHCIRNGVEIGSHSYHHDSISSIINISGYDEEISHSINEIGEKLQINVDVFALPNGQYNDRAITYISNTGIKFLLIVDDLVNANKFSDNKFNIVSRIGLSDNSIHETILKTELFHNKIKKII